MSQKSSTFALGMQGRGIILLLVTTLLLSCSPKALREKDNPVEAMQCFINASHTRTRDYHILGRVYSNMGSICHLANEFQLSYDMYEQSADMFIRNGDSLLYYYDLDNMAFER